MRTATLAATFLIALVPALASAQVQVVEQEQVPESQVVEQGYVRGSGRGVQYGAHLISPVYLASVLAPDRSPVHVGPGLGIHARIGWEFPSGFTLEVLGGLAANGVNTGGAMGLSDAFMRGDLEVGARYMFFNDTAFVPFVEVGGGLRWFFFEWEDQLGVRHSSGDGENMTGAIHGAVGAQIELSPYFGIEAGCTVDYTFAGQVFGEGIVSIMPFLGVTLYVYDESNN